MCRLTKERGAIDTRLSRPRHPDAQSSVWANRRFDCFECVVNCLDSPLFRKAGRSPPYGTAATNGRQSLCMRESPLLVRTDPCENGIAEALREQYEFNNTSS